MRRTTGASNAEWDTARMHATVLRDTLDAYGSDEELDAPNIRSLCASTSLSSACRDTATLNYETSLSVVVQGEANRFKCFSAALLICRPILHREFRNILWSCAAAGTSAEP